MLVASAMYARMHGMRKAKYSRGGATNPSTAPSGVNGMIVSTAIPAAVSSVTGAEAWLWMKGSLGVP